VNPGNGSLDLPADVLAEADWVVASIHFGQNQPLEQITRRLLKAVRHPHVSAIGHPTGRLLGQRPAYGLDLDAMLRAAAEFGCLMELNAQPSRLDLDDVAVAASRARGVRVVIDTDAHATEELAFMEFGVFQARRGGPGSEGRGRHPPPEPVPKAPQKVAFQPLLTGLVSSSIPGSLSRFQCGGGKGCTPK
jgi:DNA polymerase (family 10)